VTQLDLDWSTLSLHDLAAMLRAGLLVETGRTLDGRATSYRLTPAGRAILQNQLDTEHLSHNRLATLDTPHTAR
jgi:DNA-binding MarR family transcriptional regulator